MIKEMFFHFLRSREERVKSRKYRCRWIDFIIFFSPQRTQRSLRDYFLKIIAILQYPCLTIKCCFGNIYVVRSISCLYFTAEHAENAESFFCFFSVVSAIFAVNPFSQAEFRVSPPSTLRTQRYYSSKFRTIL